MKLVLLSVLAVALLCNILLFGCTQQPQFIPPQQTGNENQPPAPIIGGDKDSHGCIGSAGYTWCDALQQCIRPWETNCTKIAPAPQVTCALTLTPSTIYAGDSADVGFSVSTKANVRFTYNCGEDGELEISTGGLTTGSRLCQFKTEGQNEVWIKADGTVCAQKTLSVLPKNNKPKNCSLELVRKDMQAYYFEMKVSFDGFAPDENITWKCDYTVVRKMIGGDEVLGMPRYEVISCNFPERPRKDIIEVFVGDTKCGEISTRS